jgi:hypothetical protein
MTDYTQKSYGRNAEVAEIYRLFEAGRDLAMPGARRLGKSFVLDRVVDAAKIRGFIAVKVELAGCTDTRGVFRELCDKIGHRRAGGKRFVSWIGQRLQQLVSPRQDSAGPWYQPLLGLDHLSYFERIIQSLDQDSGQRWILLIDELPIFLKALHDKGPDGVAQARDFMNLLSRLRATHPRTRWLITGSIGIEPLAIDGNYMGTLAKYQPFSLAPLSPEQAKDFVQDQALDGHIQRSRVSNAEAEAIVHEVGWLAAFYLDALVSKLTGAPEEDSLLAKQAVAKALEQLLQPMEASRFATWNEHLRKHYRDPEKSLAYAILAQLAPLPGGIKLNNLLTKLKQPSLNITTLQPLLMRLDSEGFLDISDWQSDNPNCSFRNPLLRRWWQRFPPN